MTGIRIEVDLEGLVEQSWKKLPRRRRALAWLLRTREGSKAEALRRLKEGRR